LPFVWHTPATHDALLAHCASLVHADDAHAVPLQAAPPHESCTCAGHVPVPLHEAASVITPSVQDTARHWTAAPGYAHAAGSLPSQVPPQAVPSEAQAWRDPCGAPTTVVHVPALPATSHAWHCPAHAELQHTPSLQKPLAHSLAALQPAAGAFFATH
jgi:hypothetical protein